MMTPGFVTQKESFTSQDQSITPPKSPQPPCMIVHVPSHKFRICPSQSQPIEQPINIEQPIKIIISS
jgi:hypothetical protein